MTVAREGIRDALLFLCALFMVFVVVQLGAVNRTLSLRFDKYVEPLETTLSSPNGHMKTTVRTPRLTSESDASFKERHWRVVKMLQLYYPELREHVDGTDAQNEVEKRR